MLNLIISSLLTLGCFIINTFTLKTVWEKGLFRSTMSTLIVLLSSMLPVAALFLNCASFYVTIPKLLDWDRSEISFILLECGNVIADFAGLFSVLTGLTVLQLLRVSRSLLILLAMTYIGSFALCMAAEISFIISFYRYENAAVSSYWMIPFGLCTCIPQVVIIRRLYLALWVKDGSKPKPDQITLGRLAMASSMLAVPSLLVGFIDGFTGELWAFSITAILFIFTYLLYSISLLCLTKLVFYGGFVFSVKTELSSAATGKMSSNLRQFKDVSAF